MRTIFILFGIIFLHLNKVQSIHTYFPTEFAMCGKELGYSMDEVRNFIETSDSKLGCIASCVGKKFGAVRNGKFVNSHFFEVLESFKTEVSNFSELKKALKICFPEVAEPRGRTECELGLIFIRCISKYDKNDASST